MYGIYSLPSAKTSETWLSLYSRSPGFFLPGDLSTTKITPRLHRGHEIALSNDLVARVL